MKNSSLFLLIGLLHFTIEAQHIFQSGFQKLDTNRASVVAGIEGWHDQSSIQNDLINPFINPQHISREIRNENFEKLQGRNRTGYHLRLYSKLYLPSLNLFGNKSSLIIGLGHQESLSTTFDQNAYRLFFFGNSDFEGQTIPLKDFSLFQNSFSWLEIGTFSRITQNEISISIIKANRHINLNFEDARIFTGFDGFELNYTWEGTYKNAKGSNRPFLKPNGVGFGLNSHFNFKLNQKKFTQIQFTVQNFGVIFWSSQSEIFDDEVDENFTGFNASGIFDDNNFELEVQSLIDSLIPNSRKDNFVSALPGMIELSIHQMEGERFLIKFGFRQFVDPNFKPLAFTGLEYSLSDNSSLSCQLAKGGYGGMAFSVGLRLNLNKNNHVALEIKEPLAWMNSKYRGRGVSGFIKRTL